jgi:Fic family protein
MQVDARSLARAEASGDVGRRVSTTALEIIANIDAMQLAIETATDNETVELDHFIEIHAELMRRAPNSIIAGRIRLDQNWIGGNNYNPCGADFVPPPPNDVLPLLADLSQFCSDDRVPPLVQAALAHAQFETIHPFEDGNGRTGRALVQVILRRRRLAPNFVPPISVILASHRESYINGLTAYREGRLDEWLELFAVSAARAARHARQYLTRVEELQERWRVVLRATGPIRVDAAVWRLIDELPALPVVTSATAVARTDRSKPVVNRAIDQLAEVGIIAPVTQSQRYRAWEVPELLELLVGLENGDSSPTV